MPQQRLLRLACLVLVSAGLITCNQSRRGGAHARVITSKKELIGGPHALGDLGDYLVENSDVRIIIQRPGFSRGFGVFGGSVIDADIQRPIPMGDENGTRGQDNFAEMFAALFLVAMEPQEAFIDGEDRPAMEVRDGPDGAAEVVVRGRSNNFMALTNTINNALVGSFVFETIYRLPPTGRTLEMVTRIVNPEGSNTVMTLKDSAFGPVTLDVPVGDVILFGAGNAMFAPGDGGYDLRYRMAARYKENTALPALPGLIVDYLASSSEHVSYGVFAPFAPSPAAGQPHGNFVMDKADKYAGRARNGTMLVPFSASAFTGVFHTQGPRRLRPGEEFTSTRYFAVGDGDIASIADEVFRVRGTPHGTLAGRVVDSVTRAGVSGARVIALDDAGQPVCEAHSRDGGAFSMPLQPGRWRVLVRMSGRDPSVPVPVDIVAGGTQGTDLFLPAAARLSVVITDDAGARLPAKVTVVGTYGMADRDADPKQFLFNLAIGEEWKNTDMIPDTSDPATRRYIEAVFHTSNGAVQGTLRPGTYDVVVSRGPEYDLSVQRVTIAPGGSAELSATLVRVVDTAGYVSADFHIHSVKSIDSSIAEDPRVTSYAAEGVEVMVSTDHNYVMDYAPVIARLGLQGWMRSFIGLELTTLEMGHFNGYPLRYDVTPATHGSFEWSSRTPDEIFGAIRDLGELGREDTLVQVNHPRDSILGYLNNFKWSQDTGIARGQRNILFGVDPTVYPNFAKENYSNAFDAMEILNGKHFEFLHTFRVPDPVPPPPLPTNITVPAPGEIVRDETGEIAFPGAFEDWIVLLEQGHRVTGVANSDSHMAVFDEAGYPRTYVRSQSDTPGRFSSRALVDGMHGMDALMTNGPFLTVDVNGAGMGGLARAEGGTVRVRGDLRTAGWVRPSRVTIYAGGAVMAVLDVPADQRVSHFDEVIPVTRDTFILVEASGEDSLFPVVTTFDEPSLLIGDALGAIGSSFGLGADTWGNLKPRITRPVPSYALTNPVFVDVDGNGAFDPPRAGAGGQGLVRPVLETRPGMDVVAPSVGPVQGPQPLQDLIRTPVPGQALDIRRVFQAFDHHHGG